jgi:glycosyltransferase involved in cell wall biosynthesis
MRWFGGMRRVDVLPNGVDHVRYAPSVVPWIPRSAVFWGRLDFGPNVQALRWFCRDIWPHVRRRVPSATFRVMGFSPGPEIAAATVGPGITLAADVVDLRPEVAKHAVVVLPFESGGGIKNKFLEAAAMGKAIVCTPRASEGLRGQPPAIVVSNLEEWVHALAELWANEAQCRAMGAGARAWALREHSWNATARHAVARLRSTSSTHPRSGRSDREPAIEKTIPGAAAPAR